MPDLWKNPRRTRQVEAFVNVLLAHRKLTDDFLELFKRNDLNEPRYDTLRILRNAGPEGLPSQEIRRRLYTRVPDVTRLVDRLCSLGLTSRERDTCDRRVVTVRITKAGLQLLARLDDEVMEVHKHQFTDLSAAEIDALNKLLPKLAQREQHTR